MNLLDLFGAPVQPPPIAAVAPASPVDGAWRRVELAGQWVEFRIVRSAKRRTLTLMVDKHGLRAQAPMRLAEARIFEFVQEKSEWVLAQLAAHQQRQTLAAQPLQLWVLGQAFVMKPISADTPNKKPGMDILQCTFWHHPDELPHESARLALMATAEKEIAKRLPAWAGKMGLQLPRWQMSRAETRWGSCSRQTGLRFSWKLGAVFPMLVDYVIVHELAHLRQMNHSPRFWQEVEKYYPSWKLARNQLREFEMRLTGW